MSKNFSISFATDVETGLKINAYAKATGLTLSAFSALAVKTLVCALPSDFFRETSPEHLESQLKDIIAKGYALGDMDLEI